MQHGLDGVHGHSSQVLVYWLSLVAWQALRQNVDFRFCWRIVQQTCIYTACWSHNCLHSVKASLLLIPPYCSSGNVLRILGRW